MPKRPETVKIAVNNARGYIIINKSDLTKEQKLFVEKKPARKRTAKRK